MKKENSIHPELRFDPLGRDWVIVARKRAFRPDSFKRKEEIEIPPKENCPFCNLEKDTKVLLAFNQGQEIKISTDETISTLEEKNNWTTIVIPNKYPALEPDIPEYKKKIGFYELISAKGFHEVVIYKDHIKNLSLFNLDEIKEVLDVYQKRYLEISKNKFIKYISIFHNHGKTAGASIFHCHSQIIATPLIDVDLFQALKSAKRYYAKEKKCIYCVSNKWEERQKKRIVFENKYFLAICPFASKVPFEIIITPKKHTPFFEKISEEEKKYLAEAFLVVLKKLYKGLSNPDYNFYLHTAPCDHQNFKKYHYYHWHWTFLPKTSTPAGFEFGAKMEIVTITPEEAADYLRKIT